MRLPAALMIVWFSSAAGASEDHSIRFQTVEVEPGQNLWAISAKYLADPALWSEIVKHNPQIGSDPTVVLPGMKLRVPVEILKASARAAVLTYVEESVQYRESERAEWRPVRAPLLLYPGNELRTGELSRARIKFAHGSVLNLESHSRVVVESPGDDGITDLRLVSGKLKALHLNMKARDVSVAPSSKDAVYEIAIRDGSVKVDVYGGSAQVSSSGTAVKAAGGETVAVPDGGSPTRPEAFAAADAGTRKAVANRRLADENPPAATVSSLELDLRSMPVGMAVAGLRIQAARTREFSEILIDRVFDPEERITLANVGLASGVYWWRIAPVDLLGTSGQFTPPKRSALR